MASGAGGDPDEAFRKLDVAAGIGTEILVRRDVTYGQVGSGAVASIVVPFSIARDTTHLEFRVWSLGKTDFAWPSSAR